MVNSYNMIYDLMNLIIFLENKKTLDSITLNGLYTTLF